MAAAGQKPPSGPRAIYFRSSPESGHPLIRSGGPEQANSRYGSRLQDHLREDADHDSYSDDTAGPDSYADIPRYFEK